MANDPRHPSHCPALKWCSKGATLGGVPCYCEDAPYDLIGSPPLTPNGKEPKRV